MGFRGGRTGGGQLGGIWRGRRKERRERRTVLGLGLERLEERVVLSTLTWSGNDAIAKGNHNWSDAANWDTAPTSGSALIFPSGLAGAALTSNDDISGGSYASLTISGTGYTITGSSGISAALSGTIDASQTSGSSTLNLPVNFVGTTAGTVTVNNAAATLTMGGAISGSAGLTTSGSGVLDLTATNTYTGGTTVSAGTTLVDGSVLGTVALSTGATLGGVGTVGSIASTAATVSPGDSSTKTGILTDSGALTLDTNSSFDVTLNGTTAGTNYDQLAAGGTITLAGALNISTGSFVPVVGDTFTIIHNTSGSAITGTFANVNPTTNTVAGDGYTFTINYAGGTDGQDVVLTAVTAPTDTWAGTDVAHQRQLVRRRITGRRGGPGGREHADLPDGPDRRGPDQQQRHRRRHGLQFDRGPGQRLRHHGQRRGTGRDGRRLAVLGLLDDQPADHLQSGRGDDHRRHSGATLLQNGVVTATSGVSKQGDGTLDLDANDGSLTATVGGGTLLVDGTVGAVAVNTGTTIGGSGTVGSIATTAAPSARGTSVPRPAS